MRGDDVACQVGDSETNADELGCEVGKLARLTVAPISVITRTDASASEDFIKMK